MFVRQADEIYWLALGLAIVGLILNNSLGLN